MSKSCCVPGCKSGGKVPSHKFQKDVERLFTMGTQRLKLGHLINYCAQDLQRFVVCHKHFAETNYSCSFHFRKLINTAIPVMVADTIEQNQVPISGQETESLASQNEDIEKNQSSYNPQGQETESLDYQNKDIEQNQVPAISGEIRKNLQEEANHVRPNLGNVTRVRNLSPTAKSLYDVAVKLRRNNRYLKRLVKDSRAKINMKSIL
ncbi:uncharacterized protein [Temnothorax longispinosus]|uniref:uncharacterized protein n=1 Tax=Temnothorax longispinosus TaxID=300112 RepID=UPI003A99E666